MTKNNAAKMPTLGWDIGIKPGYTITTKRAIPANI